MKRFQSRIESLRRLRQQAEKLARLTAAVRQGEKAKADQNVQDVAAEMNQLQQLGVSFLTEGNTSLIQSVVGAVARTESELAIARSHQNIAEQQLLAAVQQVAHARSEVQIVEKHREREFADFRRQQLIEEENTRQENNGRRFVRRDNGHSSASHENTETPGQAEVTR